jgi:hypothetical protein
LGKGCLLDAITLHVVLRLGIQNVLIKQFGSIGITSQSLAYIQQEIKDIEMGGVDQKSMSLIWKDGKVYRQELAPEDKAAALRVLENDRDWLVANAVIVPAKGKSDPPAEMRQLIDETGADFLDDILAAQGSERVFISEDQILRRIGETGFNLKTTWLQPVLLKARGSGELSADKYGETIINFIRSGFEFIAIDTKLLLWAIGMPDEQELLLSKNFLILSSRIGGPNAELNSHIRVALETIHAVWSNHRIHRTLKRAIVGTLLENLCKKRPRDHGIAILRIFAKWGEDILQNPDFFSYLEAWVIGHFYQPEQL